MNTSNAYIEKKIDVHYIQSKVQTMRDHRVSQFPIVATVVWLDGPCIRANESILMIYILFLQKELIMVSIATWQHLTEVLDGPSHGSANDTIWIFLQLHRCVK